MSGWRKRQVTDMARESWLDVYGLGHDRQSFVKALEAFEELVRADEREACAMTAENTSVYDRYSPEDTIAEAIRNRGDKHD
jgi:hypothetical protein